MGLTYDAARSKVLMFGGGHDCCSELLDESWTWDGTSWTQLHPPTAPTSRTSPGMAYDPAHGQVVLFAGRGLEGLFLNDTWTWDGAIWTEQQPPTSPPARVAMGIAYAATQGNIMMYGGYTGVPLGDAWSWDGTTGIRPAARHQFQVEGDLHPPGSTLPLHVHVGHHRRETVTVPWKISLIDAQDGRHEGSGDDLPGDQDRVSGLRAFGSLSANTS